MKDIKALLGAKNQIDPMDKMAKLKALKDMRKVAGDMMADGVKDKMAQVSVAAPNKEGLEKGLAKAEELISHSDGSMGDELPPGDYTDEDDPMADCDTPEKIDEMMQKLAEKKAALIAKE